jgi:chromosome segregation ATPase
VASLPVENIGAELLGVAAKPSPGNKLRKAQAKRRNRHARRKLHNVAIKEAVSSLRGNLSTSNSLNRAFQTKVAALQREVSALKQERDSLTVLLAQSARDKAAAEQLVQQTKLDVSKSFEAVIALSKEEHLLRVGTEKRKHQLVVKKLNLNLKNKQLEADRLRKDRDTLRTELTAATQRIAALRAPLKWPASPVVATPSSAP